MSNTTIEIKVEELTNKVNRLEGLINKLVNVNSQLVARLKARGVIELDYSELTSEEMMLLGSALFNVSSEHNPDDDLISPSAIVKPVDWSSYA